MADDVTEHIRSQEVRVAGGVGFASVVGVALILAAHPFGTTDLYGDGEAFLDHVGWYWIALHLAAAVLLLVWPAVLAVWTGCLGTVRSRFLGRAAVFTSTIGLGVGVIHLVATDTMTFVAFRDTFDAGGSATSTAADLLLRLHAATLTAWVVSFWLAVPVLLGWAVLRDARMPSWLGWLGLSAGALQVAATGVTVAERQWTTLSEMGLFRVGATVLLVMMLVITWSMRRGELAPGVAAAAAEGVSDVGAVGADGGHGEPSRSSP